MSVISLDEWRKRQELLSELKSPSPQNIPWAELGLKPTEIDEYIENLVALFIVVDRAWRNPFTVKSDFAREGALHVAIAASEQFITTKIEEDTWGRHWIVTPTGMEVHDDINQILQEIVQPPHVTH